MPWSRWGEEESSARPTPWPGSRRSPPFPLLGHVARAAARSGVPLRVLVNDPIAASLASATVDAAHASTATMERQGRTRIVIVGDGRPTMAGLAMTTRARPAAAFAFGSHREEALLHFDGLRSSAGSLTTASAEAAQAPTLRLGGGSALIGPELFQAGADLRSSVDERTMVIAGNRLIGMAVAVIVVGTVLAMVGLIDLGAILVGAARG